MIETKARNDMDDPIVISKSEAAKEWCVHASEFSKANNGKSWKYLLIPHDEVTENRELISFGK
jgi:type III restriction enzyme